MVKRAKALGQWLVEAGSITETVLESALREQKRSGHRLGEVLIRRGVTDDQHIARGLAAQLSLTYVEPPLSPEPAALALIQPDLARKRTVLPLTATPKVLRLAMADPLDVEAVDEFGFRCGRRIEPVVAARSAILDGLARAYSDELATLVTSLPRFFDPSESREALEAAAAAAPVVRVVDHVLTTAAEEGASDVHIEAGPDGMEVRFRIDGVLRKRLTLPAASHSAVVSRIKVMANMDISVKRRPQDGGLTFRPRGVELRLRVSTLPVEGGEKVVVRILDPSSAPRTLDALGLSDRDAQILRQLGSAGQGVILAAGPTGSGKSSSLFAALAELNHEGLNIVTLEDPVEYTLPGINQVQVNPRAGLTFPSALRAILRQDPDVVMVGEIRDRETAEIAMTAAVTGHLVMSSIHTIDAPGAIARLLDMGVPPFLVAGGLTGVVAQRLLRRVCRACRGRDHENCHACVDGFRGRTGVFQVLTIDDAMREEIIHGASISTLRRLAHARGMVTLAEDARRQVAEGMTTPHEVARVIHGDPGATLPCTACGMEIPSDAIACPRCGRRRRKVCPCGRSTQSGWRFCPWCLRPVQT